ncbi:NrsF family protein [uncultured Methylobacterium sp.]|uniref:NrsF family protein n=1 Tax=uncultured Methylobacterium sp. TaxID=157278 RepID=UPI0035C9FDB5
MSEAARHDVLVDDLVGRLEPVRPLPAPALRTLAWLAAVLGLAVVLMPMADMDGLHTRLGTLDLCLATIGAALTAASAALAAFLTSVPGRSLRWALLPVAPAALWIGASGLGCLRGWLAPGTNIADGHAMQGCFAFLVAVSLPLSVMLVAMLRRACPLHPNLTAALGGLAAAAAAAALLVPFHPHDATATDLAIHAVTVLGVIGLNGLAGGRLLGGRPR